MWRHVSLLVALIILSVSACLKPTSFYHMPNNVDMNRSLLSLPQFTVEAAASDDPNQRSGHFDSGLNIKAGSIGYLVAENGLCVEGKFYQFDENTRRAVFKPKESSQLNLLKINKTYPYLDGYWGERVALVLDTSRNWNKELFKPQDAVAYRSGDKTIVIKVGQPVDDIPVEGEGRIIKGGWDHEHCAICWESIDEDHPNGYKDQNNEWVCENCYSNYVKPRRLGFIDDTALSQIRGERK